MRAKILASVAALALYGLTASCTPPNIKPSEPEKTTITITLKNFVEIKQEKAYPIREEGVPASEHILIVEEPRFMDDATDEQGNEYYFYIVDKPAGLKALITEYDLTPVENLDGNMKEFTELVQYNIEQDGGVENIIKKFEKKPSLYMEDCGNFYKRTLIEDETH